MNQDRSRRIVSRRSRPAKAPLSRDAIVQMALDILEKDGLAGLSLRRIAAALDTGPASLYVYIANLDELYRLMLDQALGEVEYSDVSAQSWRDRLKERLAKYLGVLSRRSGLAQVALSTVATGINSLEMWEALLALLKEAGIDERSLVAGVDMLLLHTTTVAAEDDSRREVGQDVNQVQHVLSNVSEEQFPLLSQLVQQGRFSPDVSDDDRFRWAIDVIVDGLLANSKA